MERLHIQPPVVQCAIDVLTVDDALRIAEAAVMAGVDWLEAGTPLITFVAVGAIGALAKAFPDKPVLADFKMMDGVRKYVVETAKQGGHIATICAQASDASIREAVRSGWDSGVVIVSDLYAVNDLPERAKEVVGMGVDSVYIHLGADERREEPSRNPLAGLPEVLEAVGEKVPVGVGTFAVEEGVEAFRQGASIVCIGVPIILADDPKAALREYVQRAKEAYHARH